MVTAEKDSASLAISLLREGRVRTDKIRIDFTRYYNGLDHIILAYLEC